MKKIEDKLSGSYYTPFKTVRFMKDYLRSENRTYGSVLEPSAGDARFIDILNSVKGINRFCAIELLV